MVGGKVKGNESFLQVLRLARGLLWHLSGLMEKEPGPFHLRAQELKRKLGQDATFSLSEVQTL